MEMPALESGGKILKGLRNWRILQEMQQNTVQSPSKLIKIQKCIKLLKYIKSGRFYAKSLNYL